MSICSVLDALGVRGIDPGLDCSVPKGVISHPSKSLTRQSFAKDADINTIMAKYAVSGVLVDPANIDSARVARFGDFSDLPDYHGLVNRIKQAQDDFMTLPSDVRARFDNDVDKLLEFVSVPENVIDAVKMGVLPESMLEATYAVRPDLRPVSVEPGQAAPVDAPKGA